MRHKVSLDKQEALDILDVLIKHQWVELMATYLLPKECK